MRFREQDDLPYRSPVTAAPARPRVTRDVENHSTLVVVQRILSDAMESLDKDFSSFQLIKSDGGRIDPNDVVKSIEARQIASEILTPIKDAVDSAIKSANIN